MKVLCEAADYVESKPSHPHFSDLSPALLHIILCYDNLSSASMGEVGKGD